MNNVKYEYELVKNIYHQDRNISKKAWQDFLENYSYPILLGIKGYCKNGFGCKSKFLDNGITFDCMIQCLNISYKHNSQDFKMSNIQMRDYFPNKQICDESSLFYDFSLDDYKKSYLRNYEGRTPLVRFLRASFNLCKQRFIQKYITSRGDMPTAIKNAHNLSESDIEIYKTLMESHNISEVIRKLKDNTILHFSSINEEIIKEKYKTIKKLLNEDNCEYIESFFKDSLNKTYKKPNEYETCNYIQKLKEIILTDFDLRMFTIFQRSKNINHAIQKAENDDKIIKMGIKPNSENVNQSYQKIAKILGEEKTHKYIISEMDKNVQKISLDNQVNDAGEETTIDIEIKDNALSLIDNFDLIDEIKILIEEIKASEKIEDAIDYRIIKYRFLEGKSPLEIADIIKDLKVTLKIIPNLVSLINELKDITSYTKIDDLNTIVKSFDKTKKEKVNNIKAQLNNIINNRMTTILKQIREKLINKFPKQDWIESIDDIFD